MTEKLSKEFPEGPTTTDDSISSSKKSKAKTAKSAPSDKDNLTSSTLQKYDKQIEEAQEKRKQEVARLRKKANRERLKQKKAERQFRNRQLMLIGIAFDYLERTEKDGVIHDQITDVLNKGLLEEKDRKVFSGRIPERHRTDKGGGQEKK